MPISLIIYNDMNIDSLIFYYKYFVCYMYVIWYVTIFLYL
jgi:hypothetical protein